MTPTPNPPADMRMMGIVHDALRRDLGRATGVLSTMPYPDDAQRVAIGEHVSWMMSFLHAHHHGEDAGLWPLVRERDPRATPLFDAMEVDHARVAPLVDACARTARDYSSGASDQVRVELLAALTRLREVLLPHLQREEDEAMPLVSVTITDAEWHAIDQQYFIKPKSFAELGLEGHWLLDGLDPERSQLLVHQVPAIPRLVIVHGFRRRYLQRATACWGPAPARLGRSRRQAYGPTAVLPHTIPRTGRVETIVAAPIDAVWAVVSDVTRVGEWSHECRAVEWLGGATEAAPGVRFRGTNKAGPWTWSRINEVRVSDRPRTFAWRTVPTRLFPDSSDWRLELEAVNGGTRIVQSFEVLRAPPVLSRVYALLVPTHRQRSSSLTDDLRRLGEVAENVQTNESQVDDAAAHRSEVPA